MGSVTVTVGFGPGLARWIVGACLCAMAIAGPPSAAPSVFQRLPAERGSQRLSAFVPCGGLAQHTQTGSTPLRPTCSRQAPLLAPELPLAPGRSRAGGFLSGVVAQYRGRGGGRGGRGRGRFTPPPVVKGPMMNSEIPFPEMRVVVANPDGKDEMLGVLTREQALQEADDRGVDLIVVSPEADPPVCKIINYDKLRYENEKKEKLKKKNQTLMQIKEVKLSYKIDVHDYDVRKRAAMRFLLKGDKVKASIRFRGREMAHKELAQKTLNQFCDDCAEVSSVEKRPTMDGRMMQVVMAPLPEALKAAERAREAAKKDKKGKKGKGGEASAGSSLPGGLSALADELGLDDEDDDLDLEALNEAVGDSDDETEEKSSDEGDEPDYDIDSLSIEELGSKIGEVGSRIREMKDAGEDKEVFAPSVDELLALKARYQELAGSPWTAATTAK